MKFKVKKIKEITFKLESEEAIALLGILLNVDRDYLMADSKSLLDNLCSELQIALED